MALRVGPDCLGTPEETWRRSGCIDDRPEWSIPAVSSVVVVAPHPDDETLGDGGLLQRLKASGASIEVVAVTDGEASHAGSPTITPDRLAAWRADERDLALARLGLDDVSVTRLRLADGRVEHRVGELSEALAVRLGPDCLCLAPWCHDGHPDHDACGRAARTAAVATGARLAEYPVWAWHWATPDGGEIPAERARRVELTEGERDRKSWAIEAFQSQLVASGPAAQDGPILPGPIVRRFRRRYELVPV
jgi:LmbE family N-acetylglucosaminyl deacetylase